MNGMFHGFEFIWAYIDKFLILANGYLSNHLEHLELTLQKTKDNGRKCNIKKSPFGQTEMEYLDFWMTQTGIRQKNKK